MQQVFQFAHVARQGQLGQLLQCLGRELWRGHTGLVGNACQQCLAQCGQVFAALAQGGNDQFNDVQTVVQVLAKASGPHFGGQVAVCGAKDAYVHRLLLRGSQGAHAALLDGA